jgi:asparagine synthase (glutamine-hydrolysing)
MCGIAGIWRFDAATDGREAAGRAADERALRAMLAAIRHRGPDDEKTHSSVRANVGVRRLSIIDLAGGAQPLSDETGTIWAGSNGELYDFRAVRERLLARGHAFRTKCDTEILPHLYQDLGDDFARELSGMFGCFVVDTARERLVLARDRFGIKPLYWVEQGGRLWFASELRCFRADPRIRLEVDPARFEDFLALGYVPGDDTIYRGVRRLPPGHRLAADARGSRVDPYSDQTPGFDGVPVDEEGQIALVERLLAASAERQLVSDVPLGVLLSGGIDSSVLTALLPEPIRRETRTFCVGFAGGGRHDERAVARRVAEHLGTRHVEREIMLDAAAWFARAADHLDEPLADPAAVPALAVADAAAREVKVVLSGTGGDELFGGYRRYRLDGVRKSLALVPAPVAASLAGALSTRSGSRSTRLGELLVHTGKALDARGAADFIAAYVAAQAPARDETWRALLAARSGDGPVARLIERLRAERWRSDDPTERAFEFDRRFYLPDDLLAKEDRMTMACSIEGRVPFLDEDLAAAAARLPMRAKIRGATGKWILRAIARRHLPAEVVGRPKHGFSVPVTEWLRGPLAERLGDLLASADLSPVWDRAALRAHAAEHRAGKRDHGGALWAVLTWESWWRSPSGPGGGGAVAP